MGNIIFKELAFEGVARTFCAKAVELNAVLNKSTDLDEIWQAWAEFYNYYEQTYFAMHELKDAGRDCLGEAYRLNDN